DVIMRTHNQLLLWEHESSDTWTSREIFSDLSGEGMEIGDIDNDGDSDIVAAGNWYEMPDNPMTDDWTVHPIFTIPNENLKFKLFDFNEDNRLDVFVGCSEVPGCTITWYENPSNPITETW